MSYRNDRFNTGMRSLDAMLENIDIDKVRFLSDRGKGVNRMIDDIERRERSETGQTGQTGRTGRKESKLFDAEMRLAEAGKSYLIRVLLLIVENGNNRDFSINALARCSKSWNAARKKYFEHRNLLLEIFKVTRVHSDI